MYKVSFIVKATNTVVTKTFTSLYKCRLFVNKLNHSKKCTLVSSPVFD